MPERSCDIALEIAPENAGEKLGIIDELKQLDLIVNRTMNAEFADSEVTFSQAGVLFFLGKRQGKETTHRAIEEHYGISNPAVSTMVKRLEAKGLVTTAISERDKRSRLVTITDAGLAVLAEDDQKVANVENALLHGMSDDEKSQAMALILKMKRNLEHTLDAK